MKRLFVCLGLLVFAAFVACDDEENPKVRFFNATSTTYYGVRLSSATAVPFTAGETTEYQEISEGTYLLEAIGTDGVTWGSATLANSTLSVKKGSKYTIKLSGGTFYVSSPSVVDSEKNIEVEESLFEDKASPDMK